MNILYSFILLETHISGQTIPTILSVLVAIVFVVVIIFNLVILRRIKRTSRLSQNTYDIMQQAMKISKSNVIYYDPSQLRTYNLYGNMLPEGGMTADEWKTHVHPDDLEDILQQIRKVISGKEQSQEFYYRWNFEFGGGKPRWCYMHNVSVGEYLPGIKRPVGMVSTLVDETSFLEQQEKEKELSDKYRLVFEQSIIGMSFYSPDGWLIESNKNMRRICNFDSDEGDEFFSKANLFEMSPFRECVDKNHIEELWMCSRSDVPERDMHLFLEIRVHPMYNHQGKLTYIAIATRDITEEREMYLQSKLNDIQIQKANEEIQRYELELQYMMEACDMRAWRTSFKDRKIQFLKGLSEIEKEMSFDEFIHYFEDVTGLKEEHFAHPERYFDKPVSFLSKMRPVFHETETVQWSQINSLPIYDEEGNLTGGFGLIRNMTKFIQAQEQLKLETQRATESGRLKSVFLANMTHEIRTPLNAIVGFSDLLQMMTTTEEKRELIHVIQNNCDMLLRLINDIMAISSMDANGLIMKPVEVDFAQSFNEMCQSLSQRVENPNVAFVKDNPYKTLVTHLDIGRMTQVLTNFVTNAVKYTQNGHIRVGYRLQEGGIYMYCEDTGTGIPKEQCSKVFERFVKLNDYVQGTGLGLSICKAIAERCNGKIGVDSEVGQGSTFWIWIPCEIEKKEELNEQA